MRYDVAIDQRLYDVYPDIRLGLLLFHADIKETDVHFWSHMDADVLPHVRADIEGKEWDNLPGLRGSRAAYRAFGRNPGRYRVSSESLLRRIRRGDELYHINTVVDVNNLISVRSGLSVGSYDLDKISGSVIFRKAEKGEGYTGIGKQLLDMENMLVLSDAEGIFGSSMSDSTRAMVTETTKNILTTIYCFDGTTNLEKLLAESQHAFENFAFATDIETWSI